MALSRVSGCALPPSLAWDSLVTRSIEAWEIFGGFASPNAKRIAVEALQDYNCLDGLFCKAPNLMMFWFFQRREAFLSQTTMTKWSRDALDDYVLLPASAGFVTRREGFFVSHFWHTKDHPDPEGQCLRLHQAALQPQQWSYIWVDWTCMPQSPRSQTEEAYFLRSLETVSGIIRNSGFMYFYPAFEARMWILYEVAENLLTSSAVPAATPDIHRFYDHVQEMIETSVRSVLDKHSYRCTQERDKAHLTSWLEVLVLLKRLHIDVGAIRTLMDCLTWSPTAKDIRMATAKGWLHLSKFEGTFMRNEDRYTFTPFPQWVSPPIMLVGFVYSVE